MICKRKSYSDYFVIDCVCDTVTILVGMVILRYCTVAILVVFRWIVQPYCRYLLCWEDDFLFLNFATPCSFLQHHQQETYQNLITLNAQNTFPLPRGQTFTVYFRQLLSRTKLNCEYSGTAVGWVLKNLKKKFFYDFLLTCQYLLKKRKRPILVRYIAKIPSILFSY